MQITFTSSKKTYFLSNPQEYRFFSVLDEKEIELESFEDVLAVIVRKDPQEYFEELYIQRDIPKIKRLIQGLDYFFWNKKIDKMTIYIQQTRLKVMQFVEDNFTIFKNSPLLTNGIFPTEFWEKHIEDFTGNIWCHLVENDNLCVSFWEKYIEYINYDDLVTLSYRDFLTDKFWEQYIEKHDDTPYDTLAYNKNLSETFWDKYVHKLSIEGVENLSENKNLTERFWKKNIDNHGLSGCFWADLAKNENISFDFFETRYHAIPDLYAYGKFSLKFLENIVETFSQREWQLLSLNKTIPEQFWDMYVEQLDEICLCRLAYHLKSWNITGPLSIGFWEKHSDKITSKVLENLSTDDSLPLWFWEKHSDKITMDILDHLAHDNTLPIQFWENRITPALYNSTIYTLYTRAKFPIEFWEIYIGKCSRGDILNSVRKHSITHIYNSLARNNNIPEEFWEKNFNKLNHVGWNNLARTDKNISIEFWEKHKDKLACVNFTLDFYSKEEKQFFDSI